MSHGELTSYGRNCKNIVGEKTNMDQSQEKGALDICSNRIGWLLTIAYFTAIGFTYMFRFEKQIFFYFFFLIIILISFQRLFSTSVYTIVSHIIQKNKLSDLCFTGCVLALNELICTIYYLIFLSDRSAPILEHADASYTLILSGVILAPIVEELVFRGLIWFILKPFGQCFALLVTTFLFVCMHGGADPFVILCLSISSGLIMAITNNIFCSVILHLIHNLGILLPSSSGNAHEILPIIILNVFIILLCLSFLAVKKFPITQFIELLKEDSLFLSNIREFFSTSGMLAYTLIFGFQFVFSVIACFIS